MAEFSKNITEIDLDVGVAKFQLKEQIQEALATMGLHAKPAPKNYQGEMPDDITRLTDTQLGVLLGQADAWCEYTGTQLALVRADRDSAEKELDLIAAKLRTRLRFNDETGKKFTAQEREDLIKVDTRYVNAQSKVLYYEALYRYTDAVSKAADRNFQTASRRITQRGQELQRNRRDSNTNSSNGPYFNRNR